jgi:hypothetical protein
MSKVEILILSIKIQKCPNGKGSLLVELRILLITSRPVVQGVEWAQSQFIPEETNSHLMGRPTQIVWEEWNSRKQVLHHSAIGVVVGCNSVI